MPTTYFVHIQRILKAVVELVSSAHLHRFKPFKPRIDDGGGVVVAMMLLNAASALPAEIKHHYRCIFCFWVEINASPFYIQSFSSPHKRYVLHAKFMNNYNH